MTITLDNYEEYLLSYIDGELDGPQTAALMAFLAGHPALRDELKALESTKLDRTGGPVFPDKALLYRSMAPRRSHASAWKTLRWAAAAVLVGLAVGYGVLKSGRQLPGEPVVAPTVTTRKAMGPTPATPAAREKAVSRTPVPPAAQPAPVAATPPPHPLPASAGGETPAEMADRMPPAPPAPLVLPSLPASPLAAAPLTDPVAAAASLPPAKPGAARPEPAAPLRPEDRLALAAENIQAGKQQLDEKITTGLSNLGQKAAALADRLGPKQIRIGHLTIAFNE